MGIANISKITLQVLGLWPLESAEALPHIDDRTIDAEHACAFARGQAQLILARENQRLEERAPGQCKQLSLAQVDMVYVDMYMHVFFKTVEGLPPRVFRLTMGRLPMTAGDDGSSSASLSSSLQEFTVTQQVTRWSVFADCMPPGVDPEWCVCSYWHTAEK